MNNVLIIKLICVAVAMFCLAGLIQTYPHPGWNDAAWGAGALGATLASFHLP